MDYVAEFHRLLKQARFAEEPSERKRLLDMADEFRKLCRDLGLEASGVEWSTKRQPRVTIRGPR
jgi:hypothetical protein